MPELTASDLAPLTREELVQRVLGEQESGTFYFRRYKELQGRCTELLEEARAARAANVATVDKANGLRDVAAAPLTVPVVGLSGVAGAGKSTVARLLAETHGLEELSLAAPLKKLAEAVFGFSQRQLYGPSECRNAADPRYEHACYWQEAEERLFEVGHEWLDEVGIGGEHMPDLRCWFDDLVTLCFGKWGRAPMAKFSARKVLQTLGTEMGRAIRPNVWIDHALRLASESARGVVVPDARFQNELDGVRAAGGVCIRISRPASGLDGAAAAHQSETEMGGIPDSVFDAVILNDGTIEDLAARTRAAVAPLLARWS